MNPGGPGWKQFPSTDTTPWPIPVGILSMVLGCIAVFGALLGMGQFLYNQIIPAFSLLCVATLSSIGLILLHRK